jgi:hypothetical protein
MNRGSDGIFNIVTVIFLVLTLFMCLCMVGLLTKVIAVPRGWGPQPTVLATVALIPTSTITNTPSETPVPTQTLTPSRTRTPTDTPQPTETPTETPLPSETATATLPPSRTLPPSATPPPSRTLPATRTPSRTRPPRPTNTPRPPSATVFTFPFQVQPGSPQLTTNLDASIGCAFQGIGGQVYGLQNQPLTGIQVNVSSTAGFNSTTTSGSAPQQFYGPAGWLVQVGSTPNNQTYTIEVRGSDGTALSPKVQVTFLGSCDQNLALVNFIQARPF